MYVSSRSLSALRVCKQKKERRGKEKSKTKRIYVRLKARCSLHNPYSTNSRVITTPPLMITLLQFKYVSAPPRMKMELNSLELYMGGGKKRKEKWNNVCLSNFSDLFKLNTWDYTYQIILSHFRPRIFWKIDFFPKNRSSRNKKEIYEYNRSMSMIEIISANNFNNFDSPFDNNNNNNNNHRSLSRVSIDDDALSFFYSTMELRFSRAERSRCVTWPIAFS